MKSGPCFSSRLRGLLMARPTIDEVMLQVANALSRRGTCLKKQVGCVVVDSHGNIIGSGYNGQPRGQAHCDPIAPCFAYTDATLSCSAIHAETNALLRCHDMEAVYTVYVTEAPCYKCEMLIRNTACRRIVWHDGNTKMEMWL